MQATSSVYSSSGRSHGLRQVGVGAETCGECDGDDITSVCYYYGEYQSVFNNYPQLEVATPYARPFQAAATILLPGEVTATAWLPTCDVVSARLWP